MWKYKENIIQDIKDFPESTYGFIYKVTHLPTNKSYIGKKVLYFERTKKLGKREVEDLKEQRKLQGLRGKTPAKKKVITESDWKTYYGSQKEIKELVAKSNPEDWNKQILQFVPSKKLLTYYETKYLFVNEVIENSDIYYNNNILGKFYSSDFNE